MIGDGPNEPGVGDDDIAAVFDSDERAPADLDASIRVHARTSLSSRPANARPASTLRRAMPLAVVVVLSIGIVPLVLRDADRPPAEESLAAPESSLERAPSSATVDRVDAAVVRRAVAADALAEASVGAEVDAEVDAAAFAGSADSVSDAVAADDGQPEADMVSEVLALLRRGDDALAERRYRAWQAARDAPIVVTLPASASEAERAWFVAQERAARAASSPDRAPVPAPGPRTDR